MKRISITLLVFLLPLGCSRAQVAPTRVLFIGNSYTYMNDLPGVFAALAASGGHRVVTGMAAPGGAQLSQHVVSPETLGLLRSIRWNFVVLQEQSEIPSTEPARSRMMYPAARQLAALIREGGATPLFMLTWAHRDGWPEAGLRDYATMQSAITAGYTRIAGELNAPLAPVGLAWKAMRKEHPDVELWQPDGSHPTAAGTFLAACVLYGVIFRQSPVGLKYPAGLDADLAGWVAGAASGAAP